MSPPCPRSHAWQVLAATVACAAGLVAVLDVASCRAQPAATSRPARTYPWLKTADPAQSLEQRIPPPAGYARAAEEPGSFASWLRGIPLKPGKPDVKLFDGRPKGRQDVHAAVVDIDVGNRDLQQCADAVMRLRAEYRFSRIDPGTTQPIAFNFNSGDRAYWHLWAAGQRPRVKGNKVTWTQSQRADWSHENFRQFLDIVFTYAGTASLAKELVPVRTVAEIQGGDVFIRGGSPGHAVIVLDLAADAAGKKVFLLAQSYMPAQDVHVLVNPGDAALSPWYSADFGQSLITPEWRFKGEELRRFR